ncbi:MAG: hypothetical protein Q7U10_07865 [Thermodesulfovibrionia bacterium]|nr:hypothetical protein [Thermodesulfovibrionia bacterium]
MKRLLLAVLLITGLSAANTYAQMGQDIRKEIEDEIQHSRMSEEKDLINKNGIMEKGKMSEEGDITTHQEMMMGHGEMMNNMKDMVYDMSNMMNDISRMTGRLSAAEREVSKDRISDLTRMMKQISYEMNNMSDTMESGMITDSEMTMMKSRVMEMQENISVLKNK